MTTVDQIMAEALKMADVKDRPTSVRAQLGEASVTPSSHPQEADAPEWTGIALTPEQLRARRGRSIAIAVALGAFVLVIFAVTLVKLSSGTFSNEDYMRPVQMTK